MNYKKMVTRVVILLNKTLGEQDGEQIVGEQIPVILPIILMFIAYSTCIVETRLVHDTI